jgi:hypothetical protein
MNDNQKDERLDSRFFYSTIIITLLAICTSVSTALVWVLSLGFFPDIDRITMTLSIITLTLITFSFFMIEIQMFLRKLSVDGINLDGIE